MVSRILVSIFAMKSGRARDDFRPLQLTLIKRANNRYPMRFDEIWRAHPRRRTRDALMPRGRKKRPPRTGSGAGPHDGQFSTEAIAWPKRKPGLIDGAADERRDRRRPLR
jgi:hypothetical protein